MDVRITIRLPAELKTSLEQEAEKKGFSVSDIVRMKLQRSIIIPEAWWEVLERRAAARPPIEEWSAEKEALSYIRNRLGVRW